MSKIRSVLIRFCTIFFTILVLITLYQYIVRKVFSTSTATVESMTSACETVDSTTQSLTNIESIDETTIFQNETVGYKHIAVAIELQDYANAINLGLGCEKKDYTQKTSYRFYVKK